MHLLFAMLLWQSSYAIASTDHENYAKLLQSYLKKSQVEVNPRCYEQLQRYSIDLKRSRKWAIKMFDATAHVPKRLFSRKNTNLGDFDQCLDVEHRSHEIIFGKYCTGKFQQKPKNHRLSTAETNTSLFNILSICLPNGCFDEEIQDIWSDQTTEYSITDVTCQTKESYSYFTTGYIVTRTFLILYCLIVVFATIYDIVKCYTGEKASCKVLIAFSAFSNSRNLFTASKDPSKISCLDGIRVLALMWIIVGHRFYLYYLVPVQNLDYFANWYNNPSSIIFTHSFAMNVDTFFLMGGAVATYAFLKSNVLHLNILSYYIKRFLRLTPPLAVVILVHAHLFRFLGSGPLWPLLGDALSSDCKSYWWSALLYLQNYVNPLNTCVISTWYLSVDMQMYILSPFILLALKQWPKKTVVLISSVSILLIFLRLNLCWRENIISIFDVEQTLSMTSSTDVDDSFAHSYAPTHMRAPTWLMGVILGYLLHQQKQLKTCLTLNKWTTSFLWTISLASLVFCTFCGNFLLNKDYDRLLHASHQSLIGPLCAMAVFCIIFLCANGYGGPINQFLSLPVFEFLAKVSYCMFITHFSVLQFRVGNMREALHFSLMEAIDACFADYIFMILVATIWHLMFEAPVGVLQNLYFKTKRETPRTSGTDNQNDKKSD